MSGSFLIFRGAVLPSHVVHQYARYQGKRRWTDEDIQLGWTRKYDELTSQYRPLDASDRSIASYVHLPTTTSCSESFKVALKFAKKPTGAANDLQSVLFVICQ